MHKMKSYVAFKACSRNRSYSTAFTIVELLVVIVVISILATITIVSYGEITSRAVVASLQSDLSNASKQLEMYKIEKGSYPTANICPTPSSTEICLKASSDNTFSYTPYDNQLSFMLTESNANGIAKYITDKNAIPTSEVNQTFNPTSTGLTGTTQAWTVPITGNYVIDAYGAQGGDSRLLSSDTNNPGGKGAWIKGTFKLTAGQIINILVGQKGYDYLNNVRAGGGGGGTFITKEDGTLLIAAGGGGGAGQYVITSDTDGQSGNNGGRGVRGVDARFFAGGTDGNGGVNSGYSGGGGGWLTDGKSSSSKGQGGKSFKNGGNGGRGYRDNDPKELLPTIDGGFGGGGGAGAGGGGGGGYSGGGAGEWLSSPASSGNGGGGGSFNGGDSQSNTAGNRSGSGLVTIKSQ